MKMFTLMVALLATPVSTGVWADNARPDWVGIWRGTIGKLPVQACLQARDYGNYGAYFYLKNRGIISLGPIDDSTATKASYAWTEARNSNHPEAGPLWQNISVSGIALTGAWTGSGKQLPIAMERVPQLDPSIEPCEDLAFSKPRITPVKLSTERAEVDRVAYTVVNADVGKQFPDVSLQTFQLDGNTSAVQNINATLRSGIPDKMEESDFFQCTMANISSTGEDGQYQTTTKPVLITANWMVSETTEGSTCGGAHPNWGMYWNNWDLRTGLPVDLWTWLGPNAAKVVLRDGYNEVTIEPELRNLLNNGWRLKENDCQDVVEQENSWQIRLTRKGLAFSPSLPHAATACIDDVNLMFEQLAPVLNETGKTGIASFRADLKQK
jgi:hypothetical protein